MAFSWHNVIADHRGAGAATIAAHLGLCSVFGIQLQHSAPAPGKARVQGGEEDPQPLARVCRAGVRIAEPLHHPTTAPEAPLHRSQLRITCECKGYPNA